MAVCLWVPVIHIRLLVRVLDLQCFDLLLVTGYRAVGGGDVVGQRLCFGLVVLFTAFEIFEGCGQAFVELVEFDSRGRPRELWSTFM